MVARARLWVTATLLLGAGCKNDDDAGELLASARIDAAGGMLAGGGLTLEIPPGAVTSETTFELRRSTAQLGVGEFEQLGEAIALYPAGLVLRVPARAEFADPAVAVVAPLEDESGGSDGGESVGGPAILFEQDRLTVAAPSHEAFINELSVIAKARAGDILVSIVDPVVSVSPSQTGEVFVDEVHVQMHVEDTIAIPRLYMSATLYDLGQTYTTPLNGTTAGDCGFRLENVVGGSLTSDCSEGPTSASVRLTSSDLAFDLRPYLSGKLDEPVAVGLVVGSDTLAYQLGFFRFQTTACFQESCSSRGTCVAQGVGGSCVCDNGYGNPDGDPFSCVCIPQCDGRVCGPDGCGGQCGQCDDNSTCNDQGLCIDNGGGDGGSTSSSTGDSSDAGSDESSGTAGTSGSSDGSGSTTG